jgi:hypothetical protein
VHNNSASPEAVRAHVAKIGLPFPIVVDHPDGRTIARYSAAGMVEGYPSYVLIGPDGTILRPSLGNFKLEILRQYCLASE